jgi:hypothetical protein
VRLFKVIFSVCLLLASVCSVFANKAVVALLPARVGNFRHVWQRGDFELFGAVPVLAEKGEYVGNKGARIVVEIARFGQDAYAYELLSLAAMKARSTRAEVEIKPGYGTAGFVSANQIAFFKGTHFVSIKSDQPIDDATRDSLISELSETFDKGENDIPALIKHLPNPDETQKTAAFLHNFSDLTQLGMQHPVFTALDTGRNADAAVASYGPSKVLVIEFNTPQLAGDNDRRIIARIQELRQLGQPAPTAYRRVGNYSVFVFDAPDEQTAKQLIDQVKYEQVVQWLGENPNVYKEAEKRYINTMLGVLVAVIKASGYALIGCLGMGALFGALLFNYRRAQLKDVTAFSDAGGMLRLNLDDLTDAETNPSRLLRERN